METARYGSPAAEVVCTEFATCTECEAFLDQPGDRWWPELDVELRNWRLYVGRRPA